tara:strand:- start:2733 stop:3167 length:435 start_codon:yes stop_codon:yes gene_type:complete
MDEQKIKNEQFLEHLNKNFTYVSDKNQYGKREAWYVMKQLPFEGDCEDYSLTYLYEVSGRSYFKMFWNLIFGGYKICFCRVHGTGHAVLRHHNWYLDNIQKKWCEKTFLESRGYVFSKTFFWWHTVAVKLIQGWYYGASKKIRD